VAEQALGPEVQPSAVRAGERLIKARDKGHLNFFDSVACAEEAHFPHPLPTPHQRSKHGAAKGGALSVSAR
jgi:hypothetical protein